ncbi:flagellar basal body rod protein FlgB [Rosenbergiella australiborealis]|uniref:Flagellar basal body rod protein FlgB n=1 Tax=Rosenbergiella australiborealis TaxID=1544696 RepID=A0ABS5T2P8_9GAMM|nr:flagellar basal body rod protein FlgB [Rosenbergiella australiborealis]MBT0726635.1 flagellar basal body rod protein FlgB [Rosenbergiella australiborealis]
MNNRLDQSFHFASTALSLRTQRQAILAANIANADTPGYQARDIPFSSSLKRALRGERSASQSVSLYLTARGHIAANASVTPPLPLMYRVPDQPSADGNTVDMDRERVTFAENSLKYQTDLTYLSNQIKWMSSAIQG